MESDRRKIYRCWHNIKRRCLNDKCETYKYYGARGITVCNAWLGFEGFYEWAINNGFKCGLTIDRIDPDRGYFPENCRWVTKTENSMRAKRKRRPYRCAGRRLDESQKRKPLQILVDKVGKKQLAKMLGVDKSTVYRWLYRENGGSGRKPSLSVAFRLSKIAKREGVKSLTLEYINRM